MKGRKEKISALRPCLRSVYIAKLSLPVITVPLVNTGGREAREGGEGGREGKRVREGGRVGGREGGMERG